MTIASTQRAPDVPYATPVATSGATTDGCLYDPDMAKERLVGAQEVRDNFSAIMRGVESGEEYVVVVRRSKAAGAFIPMRWLRRMREEGILDEPTTDDEP